MLLHFPHSKAAFKQIHFSENLTGTRQFCSLERDIFRANTLLLHDASILDSAKYYLEKKMVNNVDRR